MSGWPQFSVKMLQDSRTNTMKPIAVLGTGNSGLAMAAHLALGGHKVRLWGRSESSVCQLKHSLAIEVNGVISGVGRLEIATTDLAECISNVDLILVTTPANAHESVACRLAPVLRKGQTVVLNPGRTFGALAFRTALREYGCTGVPTIAETQTIIYTCRKLSPTEVNVVAFKNYALLASFTPAESRAVMACLPEELRSHLVVADSMIETSLGNVGMILHCFPVLMNVGWIESPHVNFNYYYDGITPSIAALLEKLDAERVAVALAMGSKVSPLTDWLRRSYGSRGDKLCELLQDTDAYHQIDAPRSLEHRYLYEDVPCGLVPLESMGRSIGLSMTLTTLAIDLASVVVGVDFRSKGRKCGVRALEAVDFATASQSNNANAQN